MGNMFKSPKSTPEFYISPDAAGLRRNFIDTSTDRLAQTGGVQGPTPLQNFGAQMLQGMMGSNFGTSYGAGEDALQKMVQTGSPYSLENLRSLEQSRMQDLPTQMADILEKMTVMGQGGEPDIARALAETAGKAETDVAAAMAPYYLQAGEGQSNRILQAAQQLLPYAQMPVTAALNAITAGNTMREQADPLLQYIANLTQGYYYQPQYGPSLGSQLLQSAMSYLPWMASPMLGSMSSAMPKASGTAAQGLPWLTGGNGLGGSAPMGFENLVGLPM